MRILTSVILLLALPLHAATLNSNGSASDTQSKINAANYYGGPIKTGTYLGKPISVATSGYTVAQVIGWTNTPPETGPFFNAFVLLGQPMTMAKAGTATVGTMRMSP